MIFFYLLKAVAYYTVFFNFLCWFECRGEKEAQKYKRNVLLSFVLSLVLFALGNPYR